MKTVCRTDRGKIRSLNEDRVGVFTNKAGVLLAVVADGMGGHKAGDVASEMALTLIQQLWEPTEDTDTPEACEKWMRESIQKVNKEILDYANTHPDCYGMGTTLVCAVCHDRFVTVGNIGDSRCYLANADQFKQLTDDHSLVNELVKSGQIKKEEAENHPIKNILLRALGTEDEAKMDIHSIGVQEGDYLILCSDGLTNKVSDRELYEILLSDLSLEEKADRLIRQANEYGGEDNITLALVHYDPSEKVGE
jgi:PPM family protein phosphatase